jgi:glycosyltransferase involved in cell wall biosynthesis
LGGSSPGAPFFSVIILTWNGRHLLEECLESVLSQTFRDFETIVVDNGST